MSSDFYCSICDAHMNSDKTWANHMSGKRHLENIKKMPSAPLPPKQDDHLSAGPSRSISLESHHERRFRRQIYEKIHNKFVSPPKYSHHSRAGSPSRHLLSTPSRSPSRYWRRSEYRSPPKYARDFGSRSPSRYGRRPSRSKPPARYGRRPSRSKSPARYVRHRPSVDEKWRHDLFSPDGTPPPPPHSERTSHFDVSLLTKREKIALMRKLMLNVVVTTKEVKDAVEEVVHNLGQNMLEYKIAKLPGTVKNKIAEHIVDGDIASLERELSPILGHIFAGVDCVSLSQRHRSSSS